MKKKYKKLIWIITCLVAVILFIFVIPIFINHLYSRPASIPLFAMSWEAKDALAFYGSILGAGATILALVATIRFTARSQKEERKLSIKPRLDSKMRIYTNKILTISEKDNFIFVDYSDSLKVTSKLIPDEVVDIIAKDKKASAPNKKGIDKVLQFGYENDFNKTLADYAKSHILILYELNNYGANNAIDVEFIINQSIVYNSFCIPTKEPVRFLLIFNKDIFKDEDEYKRINISIIYTDICSLGLYAQEESFQLVPDTNGLNTFQSGEQQLSKPREIAEKEKYPWKN